MLPGDMYLDFRGATFGASSVGHNISSERTPGALELFQELRDS